MRVVLFLHPDGLFLNADTPSNVSSVRQACARHDTQISTPRNSRAADRQTDNTPLFSPELYQRRVVIEQLNDWLAFRWLTFSVLLLRKTGRHLGP